MGYDLREARDERGRWSGGLMDSLKSQLRAKGTPPDKVHALAVEIMQNQGTLDKQGQLTAKGREREAMGHKGRIADRTAKALGRKPEEITVIGHKGYVK